ncbi:unnamed protein product [Merluccius merluccius]
MASEDIATRLREAITIVEGSGLSIGGNEVSWRHLEDFYLQDKKNVIRMAPILTERHIHLPPFTNMSVKLATQNLFSVIRGKGGHRFHPTAREFSAALRSASVGSIIGIQGCNTNCIPDDATQLLQGNPHPDASYVEQEGGQEGEQEALTYVAGWVTKKVAEEPDLGQCWECERVLVKRNNREHSYSTATREGSFIQAKKFHSSASLHEPTEAFQACIARCESSIKRELPRVWAAKGLAQKVKEALQRSGAFDEIHLQHPTHSKAIEAIALKKFIIDVVMHFSWYRQSFGGPPRLLSTIYKYEQEHTSAVHRVNGRPRFEVYRGDQGLNHLHISNVHCNDSAVYYCGSAHSNVVEFGDGVFLHVTGSEVKPQQFLNRERDAPRFWCNVHCRTRCTVDGDNPCQREDVSEKRSPFESVSDGQDCDQGGGSENLAAAMRVLVLLSIGRIVTLLLCVVVAALLRTLKSFS